MDFEAPNNLKRVLYELPNEGDGVEFMDMSPYKGIKDKGRIDH